jgi:hypothetical protein
MNTNTQQNGRGFTASLGWFVANVRFESDVSGTTRYEVSIDLAYRDGPPPGHQAMHFSLGSASEVIDLFEVTAASNTLVEGLMFGERSASPAELKLVVPNERRER